MFAVSIVGGKLSYNFKIGFMYLVTAVLTFALPFWPYLIENETIAFAITQINLALFGICVAFI
jgi:hypothetical protein